MFKSPRERILTAAKSLLILKINDISLPATDINTLFLELILICNAVMFLFLNTRDLIFSLAC